MSRLRGSHGSLCVSLELAPVVETFDSLSFGQCLRPLFYLLRMRRHSIFTASDGAARTNEQTDRPEKRRRASSVTLLESA